MGLGGGPPAQPRRCDHLHSDPLELERVGFAVVLADARYFARTLSGIRMAFELR